MQSQLSTVSCFRICFRGVVESPRRVYENSGMLIEFSNFLEFFRIFSGSYGNSCKNFCIEFRGVWEFFESTTPRLFCTLSFEIQKSTIRKFTLKRRFKKIILPSLWTTFKPILINGARTSEKKDWRNKITKRNPPVARLL